MAGSADRVIAELREQSERRANIVEGVVNKILRAVEVEADGETIKPGQMVPVVFTIPELCALVETLGGR